MFSESELEDMDGLREMGRHKPKPHEPVSGYFFHEGEDPFRDPGCDWTWIGGHACDDIDIKMPLRVALANGQRVIVRSLSEERKAARAREKRVQKAVEANR